MVQSYTLFCYFNKNISYNLFIISKLKMSKNSNKKCDNFVC